MESKDEKDRSYKKTITVSDTLFYCNYIIYVCDDITCNDDSHSYHEWFWGHAEGKPEVLRLLHRKILRINII